jgi:hypothetical protein
LQRARRAISRHNTPELCENCKRQERRLHPTNLTVLPQHVVVYGVAPPAQAAQAPVVVVPTQTSSWATHFKIDTATFLYVGLKITTVPFNNPAVHDGEAVSLAGAQV